MSATLEKSLQTGILIRLGHSVLKVFFVLETKAVVCGMT